MKHQLLIAICAGLTLSTVIACDNGLTPPDQGKETEAPVETLTQKDGITIVDEHTLYFQLFAPGKESVNLIGDFNDWTPSEANLMKKDGNRFSITISNLEQGKEYVCQYLIDNTIRVADPYCRKISDPKNDASIPEANYPNLIAYPTDKTTGIAMTVSTTPDNYTWEVDNFTIDNPEDMVIYELLIRDFTAQSSVSAAKERIPYLKSLGVNVIELMPFNEFEGNSSWGYNPSFYFATDKYYGTPSDYKSFIDECHKNGIGVFMDMVLNHTYGSSPLVTMWYGSNGITAENPYYNQKSNFALKDAQWGYDLNHESTHTKQLVDSVLSYWMNEYKIDGFRLDFTKGFSNTPHPASGDDCWGSLYDGRRIEILKRIYTEMHKRKPESILICEHLAENSEERELANFGFYLWGNLNYAFNEATMGYTGNSDLNWASYQNRDWEDPQAVVYMESHDEERVMFKNLTYGASTADGLYNVTDLNTALDRTEAAAVIFFSIPGPRMVWMFGELGYDEELNNDRLGRKPLHWEYYDDPERKALYDLYSEMIDLRHTHAAFSSKDYTLTGVGEVKKVLLRSEAGDVCAIANFALTEKSEKITFSRTGTWRDHFTGETIQVSSTSETITLAPGEYRLYFSE